MLSPIEKKVIVQVAKGLMDKEIAVEIGISSETVKNHLTHIRQKMGVGTRVELALLAVSMGLVDGLSLPFLPVPQLKMILHRMRDIQNKLSDLVNDLQEVIVVTNLKVIDSLWFNSPANEGHHPTPYGTVGLIVAKDQTTGEKKAYVGTATGCDEAMDEQRILEWGVKVSADRLRYILRSLEEEDGRGNETTG